MFAGNILHRAAVTVGDAEAALASSAFVTRNRFTTLSLIHI